MSCTKVMHFTHVMFSVASYLSRYHFQSHRVKGPHFLSIFMSCPHSLLIYWFKSEYEDILAMLSLLRFVFTYNVMHWRWRYLKLILPIYVWYHGTMKMCVLVWRTLDVSVMDGRQLLIVALYSVLRQSNPKATPTSPHPFILAEQSPSHSPRHSPGCYPSHSYQQNPL